MSCFDKQNYKNLKLAAKLAGDVFAVSVETEVDDGFEYAGISVAFQPTIENSNGKMLNVAVSYCSQEDKFKPKHGKYQALLKLARGEYIQMPLAQYLKAKGADEIAELLVTQLAV